MKFFSAFDPWPVFVRREWGRTWPFLARFATTGVIITKITSGFTEEDLKNSKFVQAHKSSRLPPPPRPRRQVYPSLSDLS
ncbi:hypothetical protein ZWY2020_056510 [Hordeum vulgare]|nr:hypothetical protein ZWY2020_056510 [Hordeum vulgare]